MEAKRATPASGTGRQHIAAAASIGKKSLPKSLTFVGFFFLPFVWEFNFALHHQHFSPMSYFHYQLIATWTWLTIKPPSCFSIRALLSHLPCHHAWPSICRTNSKRLKILQKIPNFTKTRPRSLRSIFRLYFLCIIFQFFVCVVPLTFWPAFQFSPCSHDSPDCYTRKFVVYMLLLLFAYINLMCRPVDTLDKI